MLNEDDLAFMRATQAAARPTPASLSARTMTDDGMGGRTEVLGDPAPIMVRVDGNPDAIPEVFNDRTDAGTLVKITLDLVGVHAGDQIAVDGAETYEVISDGDPDRWATAQQVIARRL